MEMDQAKIWLVERELARRVPTLPTNKVSISWMEERKKWFINAKSDKELKAYFNNFDMEALGLIFKKCE